MVSAAGYSQLTRQHLIATPSPPAQRGSRSSVWSAEAAMLRFTSTDTCHRVCGLGLGGESQEGGRPAPHEFAFLAKALSTWMKLSTSLLLHCKVTVFLDVVHMGSVLASHPRHQPRSDVIIPCSHSLELATS